AESCLRAFEAKAQPTADAYGARIRTTKIIHTQQDVRGEKLPMIIKVLDGGIESVVASDDYVGAVAAYQSWPGTCLIQGFAVIATNHPDLARRVRDRWVRDAAPGLVWSKDVHEAPDTAAR